MIISASRRTDIPAFYSEWFLNRIKEGYLLVRNPRNFHQVSKIILNPEVVDCIVFWSKNPINMLPKLDRLRDFSYYFQFTLNPYDQSIETSLPKKKETINTFMRLSDKIGRDKVIWRYDPILITPSVSADYHYKCFDYLAKTLAPYTEKCVISFIDLYKKTKPKIKDLEMKKLNLIEMKEIAGNIAKIAHSNGIVVESCSEVNDFSGEGVQHGKCIDDRLLSRITGFELSLHKDKTQREICGCVSSIDIGAYNTCSHNCMYCYANFSRKSVVSNMRLHDKNAPILIGKVNEEDKINIRPMKSFLPLSSPIYQYSLFADRNSTIKNR